jgi:hypothetical protein
LAVLAHRNDLTEPDAKRLSRENHSRQRWPSAITPSDFHLQGKKRQSWPAAHWA